MKLIRDFLNSFSKEWEKSENGKDLTALQKILTRLLNDYL